MASVAAAPDHNPLTWLIPKLFNAGISATLELFTVESGEPHLDRLKQREPTRIISVTLASEAPTVAAKCRKIIRVRKADFYS